MMTILPLLAQATQPGAAQTTQPASRPPFADLLSSPLMPLVLGILVLYFFVFRSKKNQDRQRQDMLNQLKKNDEIQTIGGIIGKVMETRDDRVLVKIDESTNTKVWFSRSAIHRVLGGEKAETK